nr:unnamed protein product [Callosobruchus chinensis]
MEGNVLNEKVVVSDVKLSKDLKKADVYIVLSSLNIQNDNDDISTVVNEMNQSAWSYPDLAFDNFVNVSKILHNHT